MRMVFIDIHCHLEICRDLDNLIIGARKNNVNIILTAGTNIKTNRQSLNFSKKYPEVKACLGLYPVDCLKLQEKQIKKEIEFIINNKNKIIAIGEIGLDLKENKNLNQQILNFKRFIDLSKKLNKPIIVHSRQAEKEAIEILENENAKKVIMHCFCGNKDLIKRIINNKWCFSVPANITFSKQFQDLVKITPLNQLFCETDSPFLHPIKGEKNNEPKNVIESYKMIAKIKNLNLKQVEKQIENNFLNLFKN